MVSGQPRKSGRLEFVDGLRAIAIIAVFLTHSTEILTSVSAGGTWLTTLAHDFDLGRTGVVTFFAISGFLIPSSLKGSRTEGSIRFLLSRFFRLFPAFWASVVPSAYTHYWMAGEPFGKYAILYNLTMIPRVFGVEMANGAYWTLEVELLFYAISLFLFVGGVIGNQFVLSCLMFGLGFIFYTSQGALLGGALNPPLSEFTFRLCLHLACMFWGAMCRQWWDGRAFEPVPKVLFWTFTGYCLVYAPLYTGFHWVILGDHTADLRLLSGYCGGLAIFFVVLVIGRSLGRTLAWIGRISYSMYLLHGPAILVWHKIVAEHSWLQGQPLEVNLICAFALTLLVADLSHRFIERPFIRLGRRIADHLLLGRRRRDEALAQPAVGL